MANSADVSAGDLALSSQYNNLRADVLNITTGHLHDGTNAREHGDGEFLLRNPADTFSYTIKTSAIVAARDLTLPLLTGDDTLVTEAHTATLANKTLTTPTIGSMANAAHDHADAAGGGQVTLPGIDIDGGTDIGAAIADGDLIIIDDGGGGTNRKAALSRMLTYVRAGVKLDDLAAPDDNTDLNFSITAHGLVPKGTNTGNFLKDDGTWAASGAVSQATQAALEAETNEDTYTPPDLIKHSPGVAKAYCTVAADGTLQANSYNITSATANATGDYTVVWDTDFGNANYAAQLTAEESSRHLGFDSGAGAPAVGQIDYLIQRWNDNGNVNTAHHVVGLGDQ